jgi:hypothetical protein
MSSCKISLRGPSCLKLLADADILKQGLLPELLGSWDFGIRNIRKQCFGDWILFRPQVRGERYLLCWVAQKELTPVTRPLLHAVLFMYKPGTVM